MKGRTASCTATREYSGPSERSAFSTDSCRLLPPSTTRTRPLSNSPASISRTHWVSSPRTATTITPTRSEATNLRTVCIRMGEPSSSMNCLRLVPAFSAVPLPIRVPRPAAGNMTATLMWLRFYRGFLGREIRHRLWIALAHRTVVPLGGRDGMPALVVLAEDHLAGRGLEHAGHRDIDGLGDQLFGVVHHDHGAVIQVSDALVILLAFLEDEDPHGLAGQHDGFQRVGQLVDIEDLDAVKLGHLVQIEIVGDDLAIEHLGEFDELHVDFARLREIFSHDLHAEVRHLLNAR